MSDVFQGVSFTASFSIQVRNHYLFQIDIKPNFQEVFMLFLYVHMYISTYVKFTIFDLEKKLLTMKIRQVQTSP